MAGRGPSVAGDDRQGDDGSPSGEYLETGQPEERVEPEVQAGPSQLPAEGSTAGSTHRARGHSSDGVAAPLPEADAERMLGDAAVADGTFILRAVANSASRSIILSVRETREGAPHIVHLTVHGYSGDHHAKLYTLGRGASAPIFSSIADLLKHYASAPYGSDSGVCLGQQLEPPAAQDHPVAKSASAAVQLAQSEADDSAKAENSAAGTKFYQHRGFRPVMFVFCFFFFGLLFYTQHEGWTFLDALYFCVVVVTTVGYGDHKPLSNDGAKVFTALFALLGVGLVFGSLQIIMTIVQEKAELAAQEAAKDAVKMSFTVRDNDDKSRRMSEDSVRSAESMPGITLPMSNSSSTDVESACETREDRPEHMAVAMLKAPFLAFARLYSTNPFFRALFRMVIVMAIGIIFVCSHKKVEVNDDPGEPSEDNYNFAEGFYWVCITGTTVGFGDYSPETDDAKIFAIFYLFLIVMVTGSFLGQLGQLLDTSPSVEDVLNRGLSTSLIEELDASGDGQVSRDEWLRGMLIALGRVDADLCDLILAQFDLLDETGDGLLDADDILAALPDTGNEPPTEAASRRDSLRKEQRAEMEKYIRTYSASNPHGHPDIHDPHRHGEQRVGVFNL